MRRGRGARRLVAAAVTLVACLLAGCSSAPAGLTAVAPAGGTAGWRLAYQSSQAGNLTSVTALARNDAWAVGSVDDGAGSVGDSPLVLHWDGRGWQVIPMPGVTGFDPEQVAASSPANVWVAGDNPQTSAVIQLVYRWDGSRWRQVALPANDGITPLLVLGPKDVWGVVGEAPQQVLYHFNGTTWTGYPGNPGVDVSGIAGTSPDDVWAVGETSGYSRQIAAERWDGHRWAAVSMPHPRLNPAPGPGIGMSSATGVWLGGIGFFYSRILLHWNGHSWRTFTGPRGSIFDSGPVVPDGHGGAWLGTSSRWTGRGWATENPAGGDAVNSLARVPGASSYWGVGYTSVGPAGDSVQGSAVFAYTPRP